MLTKPTRLAVETRFARLAELIRPVRFAVDTRPVRLAVEIRLARLAVEIRLARLAVETTPRIFEGVTKLIPIIDDVYKTYVLSVVARTSGISKYPVPVPNKRLLTVNDDISAAVV